MYFILSFIYIVQDNPSQKAKAFGVARQGVYYLVDEDLEKLQELQHKIKKQKRSSNHVQEIDVACKVVQ